jgi:hypothetical protein
VKFGAAFLCGMMVALAAARYDEGRMGLVCINLAFAAAYAIWYRCYSLNGGAK